MLTKMWGIKNSHSMLVRIYSGSAALADISAVSYKTKYTVTIWSIIVLLGIYPKGLNNYIHTKPAHRCLLTTLLIITKTLKQLSCLLLGE